MQNGEPLVTSEHVVCIHKFPTKKSLKNTSLPIALVCFCCFLSWNRHWWTLECVRLNGLVLPRFHVSQAPEASHQGGCCRTTCYHGDRGIGSWCILWFFMEGFVVKNLWKGHKPLETSAKLPSWVGKSSSPGRPCVGSLCRTKAGARKRSCAKPRKIWSSRKNCHLFGGRCYENSWT